MLKEETPQKAFTVPVTRRKGLPPITETQKEIAKFRMKSLQKKLNLGENFIGPLTEFYT